MFTHGPNLSHPVNHNKLKDDAGSYFLVEKSEVYGMCLFGDFSETNYRTEFIFKKDDPVLTVRRQNLQMRTKCFCVYLSR